MDKYIKGNLEHWNELTPIHARSEFYDIEGFKKGRNTLESIELEEVGDVSGKSLLHLQCHFGMDALSWARLGAKVTGVDFSDEAISLARSLSKETGIKADFICSDIYELPKALNKKFDIAFTSYGILAWLSDLDMWAEVISHFLRPGGTFYMAEIHPFTTVFDDSKGTTELKVIQSYFHVPEPTKWQSDGSYADENAKVSNPSYQWIHSMGDVINALIHAGLEIKFLHEFAVSCHRNYSFMEEDETGWWRVEGDKIPLTLSLKATKTRNRR